MFRANFAGIVYNVTPGTITGSGANGQVTLWNGASSQIGDAGFTWAGSGNTMALKAGLSLQLGTVSSTTGLLKLANSASAFLTTIQAGNAAAARTYTWPTDFGSAGAVLTDAAGNGTLSWAVPSAGITGSGANGQVTLWSGASAITGDVGFTYSGTGNTFQAEIKKYLKVGAGVAAISGSTIFDAVGNGGGLQVLDNGDTVITGDLVSPGTLLTLKTGVTTIFTCSFDGQALLHQSGDTFSINGEAVLFNTKLRLNTDSYLSGTATDEITVGNGSPTGTLRAHHLFSGTPTTADVLADNLLAATATTQKVVVLQSAAAHTAPYLEAQDSTGAVVFDLDKTGAFQGTRTKTIADNVYTDFVEVACTAGQMVGGEIEYTVTATDGVDYQCEAGVVYFAVVNKAGTCTVDMQGGQSGANRHAEALSAGTLTGSFNGVAGASKITCQANYNTSLVAATVVINYRVHINSGTATVTPL